MINVLVQHITVEESTSKQWVENRFHFGRASLSRKAFPFVRNLMVEKMCVYVCVCVVRVCTYACSVFLHQDLLTRDGSETHAYIQFSFSEIC